MSDSTVTRWAGWLLLSLLVACGSPDSRTVDGAADAVPEAERYGGTAVLSYNVDVQSLGVLHTMALEGAQLQRDVLFMPLVRSATMPGSSPGPGWRSAGKPGPWRPIRWR
jgi:hypothetical protein